MLACSTTPFSMVQWVRRRRRAAGSRRRPCKRTCSPRSGVGNTHQKLSEVAYAEAGARADEPLAHGLITRTRAARTQRASIAMLGTRNPRCSPDDYLAPHDDRIFARWTELETPHADLPSGARKVGVKPDYRVRKLPLSSPGRTSWSWRRSSTCPRRPVSSWMPFTTTYLPVPLQAFLANYEPVGKNVVDQILTMLRWRTSLHQRVRRDVP